jgi:hypothetical protein
MSVTGIPELKASYHKLGPQRFWLIMFGTIAWIAIGVWLRMANKYPEAYGASCHSKCLVEVYWFSPGLLQHGGALALALFVWLWSLPVSAFVLFGRMRLRAWRARP